MSNKLFSLDLISPEILIQIKKGFTVRPLERSDYDKGFSCFDVGFLKVLSQLTTTGNITRSEFNNRFDYLLKHNHEYFTIVIEDTSNSKIVGAGTIFVERKFIHHNGLVGHIEDIVTDSSYRGFNLGKIIIETLKYIGEKTGCYKSILFFI